DKKTDQLTPLELEVMDVLWETGPANVQTVLGGMKRKLAYTTVQTMLNILHKKKKVNRTLKERAYFYRPTVSRGQVVKNSVNEIIDKMFGGSAEELVMNLVETNHITPEKLASLHALITAHEEKTDASNK
ncbi:MAG: BlaI/MecI/CopY family transcriptional regulator, partial [Acidobacteriota bacterium]